MMQASGETVQGRDDAAPTGAPPAAAIPDPAAPTDPADARRIGRILIDDGLITEAQLGKALRVQERLEAHKPLAALVVELGWVSRPRMEAALREHRRELSVEGVLVEKGVITMEQLLAANEAVRGLPGRTPGRHLVELGAVSEKAFIEAYAEKHDLPFVDADPSIVDPQLLKRVSVKYLARHCVLPLSIQDDHLNVVVDDAGKTAVIAELGRLYDKPVTVCVGVASRIRETLEVFANPETGARPTARIQYHRIADAGDQGHEAAQIVDHLVARALRDGASDIHIEPMQAKLRVRFRVDGSLVRVTDYPISYAPSLISRIKVLADADIAERRIHQDGRIYVNHRGEEVDLRASFYVTVHGENVVLRVLRKDRALVGLEEMGFSPATLHTFMNDVLEPSTGIVLVTGPTGSGKTTTLYAAVARLNDDTKKIITCEDPVEYVIDGITQCTIAQRPGITFLDSLRAIVRQDPDIILIGEIRDRESAEMAIQSSLTGHKVLTTLHTEDSVGALIRLVEMGTEPFLVASTVTAVLAQRLLRKQCPKCPVEYVPGGAELRKLALSRDEIAGYGLTHGRGCPQCYYTGYRGRTGVFELLVLRDEMREAILDRKPTHELRRLAHETPGFVSLQEAGIIQALRGETTLSEVAENCPRTDLQRPLIQLLEMYVR
jgi:type IV pilus assembly protein PilB